MVTKNNADKLINDAATAMSKFTSKVNCMNREELLELIAACDRRASTNCYWLEYRLAPLLKQEAEDTLHIAPNAATQQQHQ